MLQSQHTKISADLLSVGKVVFAFFYLYIIWYSEVFGDNLLLLYSLPILLTILVLVSQKKLVIDRSRFPKILAAFFLYAVYSLITGVFVAVDKSVMFSSIVTFLAFSVVCFDVWQICEASNSTKWLENTILFCALVCSITVIFFGKPYNNGIWVRTMSSTNNPNSLAYILFLGIFACTKDTKRMKSHPLFIVILICMFSYSIVLTGSRKIFIIIVLYILATLIFFLRSNFKRSFTIKEIFGIALVTVAIVIAIVMVMTKLKETALFSRLSLAISKGTENVRFQLYRDAFSFWKESPIVGIGFGQYAVHSQYHYYSHSSYAEVLSCGGIIGVLILFGPFVAIIKKSVHMLRQKREDKSELLQIFAMLLAELILGLVMIYIYDFSHMLILTYIFYAMKRKMNDGRVQSQALLT